MNPNWYKPNLKGALLFLSVVFIALSWLPMPSFGYSAISYKASVSWPWPWAVTAILLTATLYLLSMKLGSRIPRQGNARLLTGPLLLIPQGLLIAIAVGFFLYVPPEIHGNLERHLFLQGSTDLGGGCLFAGTIALYVVFGFTSAWYLALSLNELPASISFGRALLKSLWILKYHLLLFLIAGTACWSYDAWITPNDFRNLFLFAALIYACSIFWVTAIRNWRMPPAVRLTLAPLFTILWLFIGSDGNTARAGQRVYSFQDPQPITRGIRHGLMLSWHRLCDSSLSDIGKQDTP